MKTMFTCLAIGTALTLSALAVRNGYYSIRGDQVLALLGAVVFLVGGTAGLRFVWDNRGVRFRRTRRGRKY